MRDHKRAMSSGFKIVKPAKPRKGGIRANESTTDNIIIATGVKRVERENIKYLVSEITHIHHV